MDASIVAHPERRITGRWLPAPSGTLMPGMLLIIAFVASSALVYGTRGGLARFESGIDIIIFVRRVQWLLVAVTLLSCLVLITLVIGSKTSAWCLIGLAPVLALFFVRFAPRYALPVGVLDMPTFVSADHPAAPEPQEWVVGLIFEDEAYAFPYRALYATPIVAVTDYSKRMLLIWSAHANRAIAVNITRDLRPRALEVVSTPADGLLIFDRRYGQFISSITGKTIEGKEPIGFSTPIPLVKTTWSAWRARHENTRVLVAAGNAPRAAAFPLPARAALPARATKDAPPQTQVAGLATEPPVALGLEVPLDRPLNFVVGQTRVLVVRDPDDGVLRAFERRVTDDLFPTFSPHHPGRRGLPQRLLIDSDSGSLWTHTGRAIEGPLKGQQLRLIPIDEGLRWGVMKFWYPDLQLVP